MTHQLMAEADIIYATGGPGMVKAAYSSGTPAVSGGSGNTPVIIKSPFWQMTMKNPEAVYVCINYGEAFCPKEIIGQSICVDGDIGEVLEKL